MENEKSYSIPIGGITRNTSFHNSDDGDMAEAINIRNKYGKACPVNQIEERPVLEGLDILYIHKTAQYENIIVYDSGGIYAYTISRNEDGNETKSDIITVISGIEKNDINSVSHMGNILLVTADQLYRIIFNQASGSYQHVSIPDKIVISAHTQDYIWTKAQLETHLRNINVDIDNFQYNIAHQHPLLEVNTTDVGIGLTPGDIDENKNYIWNSSILSFITPHASTASSYQEADSLSHKVMASVKEAGRLYNPTLLRAALKLYDGSYVAFSDPVFLMSSAGERAVVRKKTANIESKYQITSSGGTEIVHDIGKYYYSVSALSYDIIFSILSDIPNLEDIIDGVSLFISEIDIYTDTTIGGSGIAITGNNANLENTQGKLLTQYNKNANWRIISTKISAQVNFAYSTDKLSERINEASVYYEACFIPLSEIKKGKDSTLVFDDLPDITAKPSITIDDQVNFNNISGIYIYNSQAHIYGYEAQIPTEANVSSLFIPASIPCLYNGKSILFNNGLQTAYSYRSLVALYNAVVIITGENSLTGNSFQIVKYLNIGENGLLVQGISPVLPVRLPDAKKITVAYSFYKENPADGLEYRKLEKSLTESNVSDVYLYIDTDFLPILGEKITAGEYSELYKKTSKVETSSIKNTIRVSETSNPFVFPVEKTYTLGGGEIIGLAVATQPISQGQFGQYPLYVFCSDGIWALQVGGSDTSYSVQAPISFDVCNNPNSITSILGGIIFSTENGLKILSGNQITKIAETLDGETSNAKNAPSMENAISLIGLDTQISDNTPFKDYLTNAHIVYNYAEDELIVYNPSFPYSYCYGNGWWTKRSGRIQSAVTDYPKAYINKGDADEPQWFDLTRETTETLPLFFLTRPCKMGTTAYKRIARSILRTHINGAKTMLFLLGSNDGKNFVMVNKVASNAANRTDILLGRGIKPYKYYAFAFAISPLGDTRFEIIGIDTSFLPVHTGKIR